VAGNQATRQLSLRSMDARLPKMIRNGSSEDLTDSDPRPHAAARRTHRLHQQPLQPSQGVREQPRDMHRGAGRKVRDTCFLCSRCVVPGIPLCLLLLLLLTIIIIIISPTSSAPSAGLILVLSVCSFSCAYSPRAAENFCQFGESVGRCDGFGSCLGVSEKARRRRHHHHRHHNSKNNDNNHYHHHHHHHYHHHHHSGRGVPKGGC
jgi:hypothetical protein